MHHQRIFRRSAGGKVQQIGLSAVFFVCLSEFENLKSARMTPRDVQRLCGASPRTNAISACARRKCQLHGRRKNPDPVSAVYFPICFRSASAHKNIEKYTETCLSCHVYALFGLLVVRVRSEENMDLICFLIGWCSGSLPASQRWKDSTFR